MSHIKSGTFVAGSELLFLLLSGCSPDGGCLYRDRCAPPGVTVIVEKAIAADVDDVRLTVCWNGNCTDRKVQLAPSTDTVNQGCNGSDPDSAFCNCRAERQQGGLRRRARTADGHRHDQRNGTQGRQAGRAAQDRRTVHADLSEWTAMWPTGSPDTGGHRGFGFALNSQRVRRGGSGGSPTCQRLRGL
jgi:hypothetical protein